MLGESLSEKTILKISGLLALLGWSTTLGGYYLIDDELIKYSAIGWGIMALSGGLYCCNGVYKNMSDEDKFKVARFTHRFGSYFV